jgi:DNA mismatch endonuclease (patch repair protein)
MADIFSTKRRSELMSGIKGKDTKPELLLRKHLHIAGFRYKLHDKNLPGRPDLVFPKYKAVIQINGCFWHRHNCHLFKWPSTNKEFWKRKINGNKYRDHISEEKLLSTGWRLLIIWECSLKGKNKIQLSKIINRTSKWLKSKSSFKEICGRD